MNVIPMLRISLVGSLCLALLAGAGCASYFRGGEMSYQELREKNLPQAREKSMMFKPGDVLYSQ